MKCFSLKETKITLLTTEQAKKLPENILACGKWWWLRSPGCTQDIAAVVYYFGGIYEFGYYVSIDDIAVRPAFKIANLSSEFGEKVYVGKLLCTVIDKDLVLADEYVCEHRFDPELNDWETSELKAFIESEAFARRYIEDETSIGIDYIREDGTAVLLCKPNDIVYEITSDKKIRTREVPNAN